MIDANVSKSPRPGRSLRLVSIVGARPQFIKAAMISRAVRRHNAQAPAVPVREIILHTGQHYDHAMSRSFFDQLDIPSPRYNLGVGSGPHGRQTAEMLTGVEDVLKEEHPDMVVVYGDTNSTLAGALAAAKLHIPIAHVEAGLRSHNDRMPEEINRILTDRISKLLFCPTPSAVENLRNEGMTRGIHLVGDVMYDAFLVYRKKAELQSGLGASLKLSPSRYALATIHRQENTDDPERLERIWEALVRLATKDRPVVVPLHPRTRKYLRDQKTRIPANPFLLLIPPVSYLDMIALESKAAIILTDSGGVQKEASFAGVPCLTLRDETEWTETVESGMNVVVGTDTRRIVSAFETALTIRRKAASRLYGRGMAGRRILSKILAFRRPGRLGRTIRQDG